MALIDYESAGPKPAAVREILIGIGALALAGVIVWQTLLIPESAYAKVGPRVFGYIAAAGMGLTALIMIWQGWTGGWQPDDEKSVPLDWSALQWMALGLFANVGFIGTMGFTLASMIMFVCIAAAFGSKHPLRDAALGFALALAAYFGFAKALGVNIGSGVIENFAEWLIRTYFVKP